jgi:hypothetical protein
MNRSSADLTKPHVLDVYQGCGVMMHFGLFTDKAASTTNECAGENIQVTYVLGS